MPSRFRSRVWVARALVALLVVSLLAPAAVSAATFEASDAPELQRGTITSPATGPTVVSAQGYKFAGNTSGTRPARLVSIGERGDLRWTAGSRVGVNSWFFDVDPLPNGNLLVVSPRSEQTLVYELDPETREREWERLLP